MLPQNHFLISAVTVIPVAMVFTPHSQIGLLNLALISGLVAAAIDLDAIFLIYLKGKEYSSMRLFYNPIKIFTQFKLFMDTFTDTGLLKIAMISHMIIFFVLPVLAYIFLPAYFLPVIVASVTHFLSDLPNMCRLKRA